ncbi:signal transducer and activator of transcription B isoform X1 [Drosophila hydei]|uniref:Signal transducer and activator of transcription B isoform X1 n=1 Tax=Drosophila hydei TaxID=7224 RepID=A0A6J1MGA3_DROHY|nr:signal transducer and activator of transcription B isoform X1 [Drosophila hydei]XP_023178117.2 signal transducer and activator of transcription B isoform X1 [Drosophila hydei]
MAQETTMGAKDQHTQHDAIGDDEVSELQRPSSLYQKVREQAERFASTRLGQFVIERADRGLKLIEDTTKWSLPQDKNSSSAVLERPLPWAPFLMLIVALRLVRIWLSLGALVIGNGPVSPSDMIYFIQTRRRKLRAIRVHGLRAMRNRQQESSSRTNSSSYTQKLNQWFSRAICQPGVQRANSGRVFNIGAMAAKQQQSNPPKENVAKRPRDDDMNADHNLTIEQMLSKYANENSEDDSDFVPNAEDENTTSDTSSESESESHSSEHSSSNEEQENTEQHKENIKPTNNTSNHVQKPKEPQATLNGNEREPMEVAALKEEQWKSSPGHLSAALLNTRLYNNTAAAANIESTSSNSSHTDIEPNEPDPQPDSININSNSNTSSNSNSKTSSNSNSNSDTDSSSTSTVCPQQQQDTDPPVADPTEIPAQSIAETQSTKIPTLVNPHPSTVEILKPVNSAQSTKIPTPVKPDYPTHLDQSTESLDQPTIETLTPATSSEDIFYSPIGSPDAFNADFVNQSVLRNVIINSVPTHSTPNSELDEIHSAGSDVEEATRQCIALAHSHEQQDTPPSAKQPTQKPQQHQQQQQQQQQRQFNHPHQRYRGRNRR